MADGEGRARPEAHTEGAERDVARRERLERELRVDTARRRGLAWACATRAARAARRRLLERRGPVVVRAGAAGEEGRHEGREPEGGERTCRHDRPYARRVPRAISQKPAKTREREARARRLHPTRGTIWSARLLSPLSPSGAVAPNDRGAREHDAGERRHVLLALALAVTRVLGRKAWLPRWDVGPRGSGEEARLGDENYPAYPFPPIHTPRSAIEIQYVRGTPFQAAPPPFPSAAGSAI